MSKFKELKRVYKAAKTKDIWTIFDKKYDSENKFTGIAYIAKKFNTNQKK